MGNETARKDLKSYLSKENVSKIYNEFGIVIVLIALVIVASIVSPIFLKPSNIMNVLRQVSINGIITIGMTFVIISGGIDLSVGTTVGTTGMVIMILMPKIGMGPAILCGFGIALVIGFLNGVSIMKGMPAFIMTLAMMLGSKGFSYIISNGAPYPATDPGFKFIGQGFLGPIPMPIIIFIVFVVLGQFVLKKTVFGRSVYALGGSPEAARLSGINLTKIGILVYIISSVLATVAGVVLTSRLYSCDPTVGTNYELDAIAATVIGGTSMSGGKGSAFKAVAGVLIIGIISNILNLMHVSSYAQIIAKGIIIFLAVAFDTWKKRR